MLCYILPQGILINNLVNERIPIQSVYQSTECPKIQRKSVLHLLKYNANQYNTQMQYRLAVNFGTLGMTTSLQLYSYRVVVRPGS